MDWLLTSASSQSSKQHKSSAILFSFTSLAAALVDGVTAALKNLPFTIAPGWGIEEEASGGNRPLFLLIFLR